MPRVRGLAYTGRMTADDPVQVRPFDALSLHELHACLKLRGEVFVVGQGICAVPDVDELDPLCHHALLHLGGELIGTARLLPSEDGRQVKLGRVAIAPTHRGRGHGTALMQSLQDWITAVPGRGGVMSAQAHLEPWYTRLGWQRTGERYTEAGLDHVRMLYPPRAATRHDDTPG